MNLRKLTTWLLLGCAVFAFVNGQAPPDDDDFDTEGSGSALTTPAAPRAVPSSRPGDATTWRESDVDGSGSGESSDDEDGDDYAYEYDYDGYDYPEEDGDEEHDSGSSGGSWSGSKHADSRPLEPERTGGVGVVHAIPPLTEDEVTHSSDHKPSLGSERHPDTKPVSPYDDDLGAELDESDISIAPDVTLEELEDELEQELEDELERERERDDEIGRTDMDGLGAKPVDRNTSFFAQPGILAAVVGGAVVGLLCAILLVMLIVYRMRKKDEGSYPVDEPKRSLTGDNTYSKNKEFYA